MTGGTLAPFAKQVFAMLYVPAFHTLYTFTLFTRFGDRFRRVNIQLAVDKLFCVLMYSY